ncbi:hypothetical protein IPF37_00200 [bacterium]|nr:MAG: hypothetical protein IPF37_00200 [bacterium]
MKKIKAIFVGVIIACSVVFSNSISAAASVPAKDIARAQLGVLKSIQSIQNLINELQPDTASTVEAILGAHYNNKVNVPLAPKIASLLKITAQAELNMDAGAFDALANAAK